MIAFICNRCKKPIDFEKDEDDCVHLKISHGERAIKSDGKYGDDWRADLCRKCWMKIVPLIDECYDEGNKYLKGGAGK